MFYYKIIHCIIYIKYDIEEYERLNKIKSDYKKVYWITGYKEGGAIANILAAKLRDRGQQVYAYTFGSPMTIYNNPDEPGYTKTGYSARYDCIFNIINEDDPYAYIMPQSLGFSRYGMTCYGDGNKVLNGYIEYKPNKEMREEVLEYVNLIYKGNEKKTRTYTYSGKVYNETVKENGKNVVYKTIKDYIEGFMKYIHMDRKEGEMVAKNQSGISIITKNLEYFCKLGSKYPIKNLKNKIKLNYPQFKRAGDADVYYIISREMENSNITNIVNLHDKKEQKIARKATVSDIKPQELMAEAVEIMGQMYVKNVSTYESKRYSLEEVSKDVDSAYIKNQYNTLTNTSINEQKDEIKQKFESLINENDWFKCGDDCVRFMFSVIFYANNGDLGLELSNNNSETYYTMFGNNALVKNTNDKLFEDLGFKIYYIGEIDEKGHEFGYKDLEDGDIVIAYRTDSDEKGHVEFYINDRYGKNGNGTYDWSFGWGDIRKRYPINGNIGRVIKEDDIDNNIISKLDINYKNKYLRDNFTNLTYDGDKDGKPDRSYELRYFKVLRKVK